MSQIVEPLPAVLDQFFIAGAFVVDLLLLLPLWLMESVAPAPFLILHEGIESLPRKLTQEEVLVPLCLHRRWVDEDVVVVVLEDVRGEYWHVPVQQRHIPLPKRQVLRDLHPLPGLLGVDSLGWPIGVVQAVLVIVLILLTSTSELVDHGVDGEQAARLLWNLLYHAFEQIASF